MPRLRNFDTKLPFSYCYELQPEHRLESVANAHTAADLHVRPCFLNRAGLKKPWAPRTFIDVHQALIPATKMIRCESPRNAFAPTKSGSGFGREWQGVESAQRFKTQKRCDISDNGPK